MKIGIIRETKEPEDNRVILAPQQLKMLQDEYTNVLFQVQASSTRAYADDEYRNLGIRVVDDVSDSDILLGIKEASLSSLIPDKHYFFFGHVAKMQEYNRPLLQKMMKMGITFSDYEYLVDDNGERVCAFGWWAGVVGVYNTLRAYGLKYSLFELPQPDKQFTLETLIHRLSSLELPPIRIIVTGNGRVSHGAQFVLDKIGVEHLSIEEYLRSEKANACYCVADVKDLVKKDSGSSSDFDLEDFKLHGEHYSSQFDRFCEVSDLLLSCHFWTNGQPVYLDENLLKSPSNAIKVVGDITCDIQGSIKSTLRASTHAHPFYDYNPHTGKEEVAFSCKDNITVMAVDTLPNALARDTSEYFGNLFMEHVLIPLLKGEDMEVVKRATILDKGRLTDRYAYLQEFACR